MKTIVIDNEPDYFQSVAAEIQTNCPQMDFTGVATSHEEALKLIDKVQPALIFMDIEMPETNPFDILKKRHCSHFETIFVSNSSDQTLEAFRHQACGYILKPLKVEDVVPVIKIAQNRIKEKQSIETLQDAVFPSNIIGIPTIEGFEFLTIEDIIRCEGFQRCTRIITKDRSDIISSYHIGVFRNRLLAHRFYSTHKSHLINLCHIRSYMKEGTIKMSDGTCVPVSKRRKSEFINLFMQTR